MDIVTEKNTKQYDTHAKEWQASMDSNLGHKYLEKPAMEQELPKDLTGKAVLCIDVEFYKMEMTDLSFPDNSFDLIYSSLTFHYAKDWDILLSEIRRVLKESC